MRGHAVPAGTAQRTMLRAHDAIWSGSHLPSTERSDPQPTDEQRVLRSRHARGENPLPSPRAFHPRNAFSRTPVRLVEPATLRSAPWKVSVTKLRASAVDLRTNTIWGCDCSIASKLEQPSFLIQTRYDGLLMSK